MHDMGLSTQIGREDMDASGKGLTGGVRTAMERLRIWDIKSRAHSAVDRNLRQAFSELDRLANKLSISDVVIERAALLSAILILLLHILATFLPLLLP